MCTLNGCVEVLCACGMGIAALDRRDEWGRLLYEEVYECVRQASRIPELQ